MIIGSLSGLILRAIERFILTATAEKAKKADPSEVSRILYPGAALWIVTVIGGFITGAYVLDTAGFACLVVLYTLAQLATVIAGLWGMRIRSKNPRKQQ